MTKPQRDEKGRFLPKKRPGEIVKLERRTKMMWLPTETYPDGVMRITCDYPMPNIWYRFWGRVLLGVRWVYVYENGT